MTKEVAVRNIKADGTTEDLEVGSSGRTLFQIKQTVPARGEVYHVLVSLAEAKALRDLLTEWLDDEVIQPVAPKVVYKNKYVVAQFTDGVHVLEYDRGSQKYFPFSKATSLSAALKIADTLNKEDN